VAWQSLKKFWVACESELMFWVAWQSFAVIFPVVSQELTNFGSVFEVVGELRDRNRIGIRMRRKKRRLRGDKSASDGFACVEVNRFA
jgi:hypothetical protein